MRGHATGDSSSLLCTVFSNDGISIITDKLAVVTGQYCFATHGICILNDF